MSQWKTLLNQAIDSLGQAEVARRLGLSPATICMARRDEYPASTDNIAAKIIETFGGKPMEIIPQGYKKNAVGHLVPIESIKDEDLARDQFVTEVMDQAKLIALQVAEFKLRLAADMQAFIELSAEKYDASIGGQRGNVTLTSFDGRHQIMRAISDRIEFDEKLLAAKSLIDECLREWTRDSGSEIKTLVESAFIEDRKGKINIKRILGLQKLKIEDPRWLRAMNAIKDAVTVVGSCTYFRIYERDEQGKYQQLALDFSSI